ncbi:MAG: cobamide remodeling phosphodiesterase CbiR [Candidatus Hodarchaeota archaeon]
MALRFGVLPFNFQDFFMMVDEGKVDITKVNYIDLVKVSLEDKNIEHFEITGDLLYVLPGLLSSDVITQLEEFKSAENYTCSVHLPLWSTELACPNSHIRKASIECLIEAIELTKELDPEVWVVHATGALISEFTRGTFPDFVKVVMEAQFASEAQNSLEQILDQTNIPSRKLAVENVEFPFRTMDECLESLDLSVCLDTGHVLAGYSGDWENGVVEFFETYKDRIIELHLHDGRKPRIDHKALGQFDLPVKDLFHCLIKNNFSGPIVYELTIDEVKESMAFIETNIPDVLQ